MTREEAIKILDPESSTISATDIVEKLETISEMVREANRMAISALRAQQTKLDRSRWDGCGWCRRFQGKFSETKADQYCKLCGRPLTEAARAELERRIT